MEIGGWIKLHRNILDWEWYGDINTKVLFLHLLLTANFKQTEWQGVKLEIGQRIISIRGLQNELNLSYKSVRVALEHLKSTGEIITTEVSKGEKTTKTLNKVTVLTLKNYEKYQENGAQQTAQQGAQHGAQQKNPETLDFVEEIDHQNFEGAQQRAQYGAQQRAQDKEYKNKEDKNREYTEREYKTIPTPPLPTFGIYQNVFISQSDFDRLKQKYPDTYEQKIDRLSEYMQDTNKRYSNHYLTICRWAREDEAKQSNQSQYNSTQSNTTQTYPDYDNPNRYDDVPDKDISDLFK